jgi:predicted ribosomally synthesized peptide with SipW-like signal peptide
MNSYGILLLLVLGALAAFLLLTAQIRYFMRYKEFQTVREKMNHADGWKEFVSWHREYSALLWSLLPGLSAVRVKEIRKSFSRRRSDGRKRKSDGFASMLAPSLLGICVCAVCLVGGTYAWFTATKTAAIETVQTASYTVETAVTAENGSSAAVQTGTNSFSMEAGTYEIQLAVEGDVSTGYCILTLNDEKTLVTEQIAPAGTMTFTLVLNEPASLKAEAVWGDSNLTADLSSGDTYTYGSESSSAKASNVVVPELSESSVQTAPAATENTGSASGSTGNADTEGQEEPITVTKAEETYTVAQGDTLETIAAKYGTTVEKLMEWNNITEESELQVGQILKIPSAENAT